MKKVRQTSGIEAGHYCLLKKKAGKEE